MRKSWSFYLPFTTKGSVDVCRLSHTLVHGDVRERFT
jgi:hypothetical protein